MEAAQGSCRPAHSEGRDGSARGAVLRVRRGGCGFRLRPVPADGAALGMEDEDFLLALRLQREWEEQDKAAAAAAKRPDVSPYRSSLRPLSVVDEAWELLDPSPDVHGLFVHFNQTLFWGKLEAVTVSWSPRMTRCGSGGCGPSCRGWAVPGAVARAGRAAGGPVPVSGSCPPCLRRPRRRARCRGGGRGRRRGAAACGCECRGGAVACLSVLLLAVPR